MGIEAPKGGQNPSMEVVAVVKGSSRQVIVVNSPDEKLFEQAIFILKDGVVKDGISDRQLLQEARRAAGERPHKERRKIQGPVWAFGGAATTAIVWLISMLW